ncbi:uncharacterized protein EI90DRAFT_3034109, partial [Cantharellus anzutake]|uniref:uncharacterized protein n=1 Tax=Cantharellus anzutake TaxID=1750568 RepID=UPI001906D202
MVCYSGRCPDIPVHCPAADRLPFHSCLDEYQCTRISRVLYTLTESLSQLDAWYTTIGKLPKMQPSVPHPRFFPTPRFFEQDGNLVEFEYERPFEPEPDCKTFLATRVDDSTKVVVKFVTDYGADAHRAMEKEGFAPNLLYCGPVNVIPEMPCYGELQMVIMEYVAGKTLAVVLGSEARNSSIDALNTLPSVIESLHAKNFVYGDLRPPNIIITVEGKVQLIDFDWAGKNGEARYPLSISTSIKWPEADQWERSIRTRSQLLVYVNGVCGLAYIRPEHDRAMLDLFLGGTTVPMSVCS